MSIFIVIAMAVCWHSTDEGGFGQQEMSVACLVGTRPACSEQIAITGENIGFRFKKNIIVVVINERRQSLVNDDNEIIMILAVSMRSIGIGQSKIF